MCVTYIRKPACMLAKSFSSWCAMNSLLPLMSIEGGGKVGLNTLSDQQIEELALTDYSALIPMSA